MTKPTAQKTIRLTMAQALVKYLQVQYSERDGKVQRLIPAMFGIFGHGNLIGIGQSLDEYGDDLMYYQPCNEQSMVHTAAAFAKANLRLSTLACSASIGPGSTNMITGAAGATINRLPVLLLPSDYYANRRQGPVLQQVEHPISGDVSVNDCFRPVSRFFDRISRPEQLLTALPEAMRVLTDPADTGAVTLSLPQDVQAEAFDYPVNFFEKRHWRIERRLPDPQRIAEAIDLLKKAKRPMIIAGGGVHYSQACQELKTFAQGCGIPAGETTAGKGVFQEHADEFMGGFGTLGTTVGAKIARDADLVFCIGTRLTDFDTGSHSAFQHPDVKFIAVNVCGHDAYKMGALTILADAREGLRALCQKAQAEKIKPDSDYLKEVARWKDQWQEQVQTEILDPPTEVLTRGKIVLTINKQAQKGDTITSAAGTPVGDLHQLWDATGGRNCHLEFGNSCMGYEIPAGVGIRMTQTDGEVYVLVGDGTYLMNPTDLVTAMQHDLKITLIVVENHGFQSIHGHQKVLTGHGFGTEFRYRDDKTKRLEGEFIALDFAKNAESMGAKTWNVKTADELTEALQQARRATQSCVIVAETDPYSSPPSAGIFWDFTAPEVSRDAKTQELRRGYEKKIAEQQRFYY